MSRRVNMPAAEDLFRPTAVPDPPPDDEGPGDEGAVVEATPSEDTDDGVAAGGADETANRGASGRVRHDEKMTVYVTADELLDLEHARLQLRRHHGIAVDRGRLVREAVALVLADLTEHGTESPLVRRLGEE